MEIDERPILVSIWCLTYNQEKYIRQCLDGFVMQKTNFRFEAIVHDDASTDGTADIVREYAEKYPDIIKPIIEIENQYSKQDGTLDRIMFKSCIGKYIAMCEGDDYWTDPLKLQKQVDYLEEHPECSCCVTDYQEYYQSTGEFRNPNLACLRGFDGDGMMLDIKYYSKCIFFTKTLTAMYRREAHAKSKISQYAVTFDMMMFYALATQGNIYLMNEKTGVYRINEGSTVSSSNVGKFNRRVLPKLFSICEAENTQYARDFIYNYMKSHVYWMLKDDWKYIFKYYKYLGCKNATKIMTKDLGHILIDIVMYKLKLK